MSELGARIICWLLGHDWWYGGEYDDYSAGDDSTRNCHRCGMIEDLIQGVWVVRR